MKWFDAPAYYFNYAFNEVAAVFYDRYPNSFAKHILCEDVLSREVTKDQIITRKLIVKQGAGFLKSVPRWLSRHAAVQTMPTLEESVYDRRTKTMTTYTRNVSWSHLLQMQEKCTYRPTNDHTNRTELSRRLFVMVDYSHISGLAERVLMMTFRKSVKKTLAGVNEKLEERYGPATAKIVQDQGQSSVAGHASKIRESIKSKIELGKA